MEGQATASQDSSGVESSLSPRAVHLQALPVLFAWRQEFFQLNFSTTLLPGFQLWTLALEGRHVPQLFKADPKALCS